MKRLIALAGTVLMMSAVFFGCDMVDEETLDDIQDEIEDIFVTERTVAVGNINYTLRAAPPAEFPTGIDDQGSSEVENPFWIGKTEVTYELWYAVRIWAEENGFSFTDLGCEGSNNLDGEAPTDACREPVTNVSWGNIIVWCNALSEMTGKEPVYTYEGEIIRNAAIDGIDDAVQEQTDGFRLPTGDEWELAARFIGIIAPTEEPLASEVVTTHVGDITIYWTPGNYASGASADVDNIDITNQFAWYKYDPDDIDVKTMPVGMRTPNALGLYDMSGNIYEYCFTRLSSGVPETRGGNWLFYEGNLRIGEKMGLVPMVQYLGLYGFRLAADFSDSFDFLVWIESLE